MLDGGAHEVGRRVAGSGKHDWSDGSFCIALLDNRVTQVLGHFTKCRGRTQSWRNFRRLRCAGPHAEAGAAVSFAPISDARKMLANRTHGCPRYVSRRSVETGRASRARKPSGRSSSKQSRRRGAVRGRGCHCNDRISRETPSPRRILEKSTNHASFPLRSNG